jgi:glycosyltransferase involved in cell wall biosynthesis
VNEQRQNNLKTVVVCYDYGYVNGGAAKVAIAGALGLRARGYRVIYFAPVGPMDPRFAAAGVETVCLDQQGLAGADSRLTGALSGIWNVEAARRLKSVLGDQAPESTVIYQHGWSKAMSPSCQRVIAQSGIPSLYYMHEYFAACPNGAFFDYPAGENCARTPMSLSCVTRNCDARAWHHKAFRVMRHGVLNSFGKFEQALRHIIYISELQLRVMRPWLLADIEPQYAPNPIDVADIGPAAISKEAPFLFVGRFSREKGAHLAAEAAARLNAPIQFVGDGEMMNALKAAAPNAAFTGWVAPERATELMRKARALVLPSLWYECQPLTVLEALANGIPVIVSDNCAGAEFVADGETGLHVASQDIDALVGAMAKLMDDNLARSMGGAAHERYWQAPHTLDRHIDVVESSLLRASAC